VFGLSCHSRLAGSWLLLSRLWSAGGANALAQETQIAEQVAPVESPGG
jgi:hypothetical protein